MLIVIISEEKKIMIECEWRREQEWEQQRQRENLFRQEKWWVSRMNVLFSRDTPDQQVATTKILLLMMIMMTKKSLCFSYSIIYS